MELSPSRVAATCAATQENVHNSPALVPILSQTNLVVTTQSCSSKTHLNIIHPPTS
jgi:hypothetical protein